MWPILWCDLKQIRHCKVEVCCEYSGAILIKCRVRNDGPTWNVVLSGIMSEMAFHVEWCNVKWGSYDVMRCNGSVIHSTTTAQYQSHIKPHFLHGTPHLTSVIPQHTRSFNTAPDHTTHGVMWNSVVWNLRFCNARCVTLCLIHPNAAAMWNKVRCRIWAIVVWC